MIQGDTPETLLQFFAQQLNFFNVIYIFYTFSECFAEKPFFCVHFLHLLFYVCIVICMLFFGLSFVANFHISRQ